MELAYKRNFGIIAHIDAGKTTTTERLLFYSGRIHRIGDVDDGNTVTDFMDQERERGITIVSAAVSFEWRGHSLCLIDTPGHVDFTAEVERSLRVLDGCVVVFCAVGGVQAQTETVWRQADRYRVPRMCYINKMDRTGANFDNVLKQIRDRLTIKPVVLTLPIGKDASFEGVIDVLRMKALYFDKDPQGTVVEERVIPEEHRVTAELFHHQLMEDVAEFDDACLEKFLHEGTLSEEELRKCIRAGTLAMKITPVFTGASFKKKGVQPLMDAICHYLPSPLDVPPVKGNHPKDPDEVLYRKPDVDEPFCGLVFKIQADPHGDLTYVRVYSGKINVGERCQNATRNEREIFSRLFRMYANNREKIDVAEVGDIVAVVGLKHSMTGDTLCFADKPILLEKPVFPRTVISMACEPKSSADRDRMTETLHRLMKEDPTFVWRVDHETGQTIISGMGELHLDVLRERMLREFKVDAKVGRPMVSYRETITKPIREVGKYVHQSGGKGQFGHVVLEISPNTEEEFTFETKMRGEVIPREFFKPIEMGCRSAMSNGPLAGFQMVNVKVVLVDGSHHEVDSSAMAFEAAASIAFASAVKKAGPIMLEPIMSLEVVVPEEFLGNILGDLNSRRASIGGTETQGKLKVIHCKAPLAEMFGYSTSIRSMSQGRATYSMEPCEFHQVPASLAKKIIEAL